MSMYNACRWYIYDLNGVRTEKAARHPGKEKVPRDWGGEPKTCTHTHTHTHTHDAWMDAHTLYLNSAYHRPSIILTGYFVPQITHTHTHTHMHAHIHTHTHKNMRTHARAYTYVRTYILPCTHTHTHTHVHREPIRV